MPLNNLWVKIHYIFLVNNAGIAHIGNVGNTTGEAMDKIYNVNVKGVYHCMNEGVQKMIQGGFNNQCVFYCGVGWS